jgi:hypothetical protein
VKRRKSLAVTFTYQSAEADVLLNEARLLAVMVLSQTAR